jgi:hypothetical protein
MLKVRSRWPFALLILLALVFIPAANATLMPLSFGFPTMTNSVQNTAFNQNFGKAFDIESANFQPWGSSDCGFPTLGQSSIQGQTIGQINFAQSTVVSAYSYPAVSTGMGFAGFNINGFGSLL